MSFMFNPYPYDDSSAVNRPPLPESVTASLLVGNEALAQALADKLSATPTLALDGHVGVEWDRFLGLLQQKLRARGVKLTAIDIAGWYKSADELEAMLAENLPTDKAIDPVLLFGKIFHGSLDSLFDAAKLEQLRTRMTAGEKEVVCVYGCGAAILKAAGALTVYFDLTPQQITLRILAGRVRPLGDRDGRSRRYIFRRLYYYDYEVMARHRQALIQDGPLDFYVDSNQPDKLKALPAAAFRQTLAALARQPFRSKPVYIEGVWGGQYIKKLRHLPADMKNCAWVFDLIPNEVSVLVKVGKATLEVPYPTFYKAEAEAVMGAESVKRFGLSFPIRFNYDDTYGGGGGNMSIQIHPPAEYARTHFNEPCQQDESYYVLETGGSRTYLGLQDEIDVADFAAAVRKAETERVPMDYDRYVNSFASAKGDQFLLPGGTIHASGRNQVVLEIGACTVGSYTFKLYDYLRLDLDGVPRPIHSQHGLNVLNASRRRSTVDGVLRPQPKTLREGPGWKEVLLGEHPDIYFSLRRLEFDREIEDDTQGTFHVLVLVEGDEVLVQSLAHPALRYRQRYADMLVVPASIGRYMVLNLGDTPCKVTKTLLKQSV